MANDLQGYSLDKMQNRTAAYALPSDIVNLISDGNVELANVVCDSEINRLLGVKRYIMECMKRPLLGGNFGFGLEDGLNPSVLSNKVLGEGAKLGGIGACLGRHMGFMDHKAGVDTRMAEMAGKIGQHSNRLN